MTTNVWLSQVVPYIFKKGIHLLSVSGFVGNNLDLSHVDLSLIVYLIFERRSRERTAKPTSQGKIIEMDF